MRVVGAACLRAGVVLCVPKACMHLHSVHPYSYHQHTSALSAEMCGVGAPISDAFTGRANTLQLIFLSFICVSLLSAHRAFSGHCNLRHLALSCEHTSDAGLAALSGLAHLADLTLCEGPAISAQRLVGVIQRLPRLAVSGSSCGCGCFCSLLVLLGRLVWWTSPSTGERSVDDWVLA